MIPLPRDHSAKEETIVNQWWDSVKWFWTIIGNVALEHFKFWSDKFREEIKND